MGDANPIHTLKYYSKPSLEGYRNPIELPEGNNVVPLRSDTIRKDRKTPQRYPDVPITSKRISLKSMDSFQGLTTKSPSSWHRPLAPKDLTLYDNESWNDPRDFAKPVKAISLPQDVPKKRLSSLRTQLRQQQDDIISEINLLWKPVFEKLDDTPIHNTAGIPVAQMNFMSTNDPTREELRAKVIKSPSKLLSLKYMSQSSLAEQNRNPSSPKRVHFINSIFILNREDEAKEEGNVKSSTTKYEDHEMTVESEEELEEETEKEIEEEEEDSPKHFDTFPTMKELRYHEWILKNPRPHRLGPRKKPSNLGKIYNFMGRVKGLKVFVENFTYECDFVVLEDTTSVIDHDLGLVVFEKPFVEATGLVYDREKGTITFKKDKEKIVFKMPHKMEMFKHIDFTDIKTDHIPPFVIESDDDNSKKTHYSDSLDLGPEYKYDENVCRAIRSLIAMKAKRNKGVVMKFLIKNEEEIFTVRGDGVGIKPDGVASPAIFRTIGIHGSIHLMKNWGRSNLLPPIEFSRKVYLLEDNQIPIVGVFDEVEVNELRAERLARAHDPLALMENSNNPYNYPVFHQDQPSQITYMQQPLPNNNFITQPLFNKNYMQQPMPNPEDITDPTTTMNMADCIAGYEFGSRQTDADGWRLIVVSGIANQNVNQNGNGNVVAARAKGDLDKIEEVNANCILMASLQQASTSGTQTDKAPVYDSDGSAEVHHYENCYDNDILISSVEHYGRTVEQNPATVEETRVYFESLYNNLAIEVDKVNSANRKMKETNADLTTELAIYKNQEKCFEINQEKYDKLERCYQKFVYQEQCLIKKINVLHLSSAKTITTLNKEIANLNNQLSKEKSTVSLLQEEKKKLKSDFKTREDELLYKQI
ncbi:hypothetical protein Tco_1135234 [Tanacetum coccineum]